MPRNLEIHHIDVGQGDSTLILVKNPALVAVGNPAGIEYAALIDAGKYNKGLVVHNYLATQQVPTLNLIVASHYDEDHFWGLRYILARNEARYTNTTIFDRGEEAQLNHFGQVGGRDEGYQRYIDAGRNRDPYRSPTSAVNTAPARPGRNRRTAWVNSHGGAVQIPAVWSANAGAYAGYVPPVIGGQRSWRASEWPAVQGDVMNLPALGGIAGPTMTCIGGNRYMRLAGGGTIFVFGGGAYDDNPDSLCWLIRFNNFRYFTAGDLPSAQEDVLDGFLNPANNAAGHVCAFKVSHHGSSASTSTAFLARIRPTAAFISCGDNNTFNHPTAAVIGRLQAQGTLDRFYLTSCGGASGQALLVGCNGGNQLGAQDRVAGDSTTVPVQMGNAVLHVSQVQSLAAPHQFDVNFYDADQPGFLVSNLTC